MAISPEQFRAALGRWPSGVSIVTARSEGEASGMTVSAFFSVSLTPPLIAVSIDQQALTLGNIVASGFFAVNVLSIGQTALSDRFATNGNEQTRFDGIPLLKEPAARSPLLGGAVLHLDCQLEKAHVAGDHVLVVGRILLALAHAGEPLLYHGSHYHRLAALEDR